MAVGDYTDLVIRPEYFESQFIETLNQKTNLFNEASQGCIVLDTTQMQGHYGQDRFWDLPTNLVSARDIADTTTTLTDIALTMDETISVKVDRNIGPVAETEDAFFKKGSTPAELSMRMGEIFAAQVYRDYLNAGLNALEAAMSDNAVAEYDYSGTGSMAHVAMIRALATFGDQADRIKLWVSRSEPWFDLLEANLSIASGNVADVTVYNASAGTLGRPLIQTDSAALVSAATPLHYYTLGLVPGALTITASEMPRVYIDRDITKANVILRWRGEYAFNIGVRGHKWNTGTGVSPNDAAIATNTNWVSVIANEKDGPGVYLDTL